MTHMEPIGPLWTIWTPLPSSVISLQLRCGTFVTLRWKATNEVVNQKSGNMLFVCQATESQILESNRLGVFRFLSFQPSGEHVYLEHHSGNR